MKNRTNSCKKWLAVLLSVSMLPTAILQNGSMAYAEEKKQEEAVTAEEALEDREADIVVEEISISNKEEFLKYVQKCQDDYYSYGRIFNLQNDIDLSGSSFDGIPYFAGTFNGNGHTVSGLKISREGSDYGFFRYVGKTGRVKDLTVSGSVKVTGSAENVGGVVGTNYGILENCSFEGIVTGNTNVGGIVGENRADGIVLTCYDKGTIVGTNEVGGICGMGAFLSFPVFFRDYPLPRAIGLSLFHSVASFNNSGFDVLGNGTSLIPYQKDVFLNLVTCALVIAGGIGFPVIFELPQKHFSWKRLSMHTRVVLSTTFALLLFGTLLLKLTENISWLGAFFYSVSARTAGFSTYNLGDFSTAGLLVVSGLMFIGASPASTGGGIKTTTFFVLLSGIYSAATNHSERAFHSAIPKDAFRKASVISMLAVFLVMTASYLMLIFDPQLSLRDVLFEMISAFSTSGLSTGITPQLSAQSRILSIIMMYIGRLGPLTVASLWYFTIGERVRYPEGTIAIG